MKLETAKNAVPYARLWGELGQECRQCHALPLTPEAFSTRIFRLHDQASPSDKANMSYAAAPAFCWQARCSGRQVTGMYTIYGAYVLDTDSLARWRGLPDFEREVVLCPDLQTALDAARIHNDREAARHVEDLRSRLLYGITDWGALPCRIYRDGTFERRPDRQYASSTRH